MRRIRWWAVLAAWELVLLAIAIFSWHSVLFIWVHLAIFFLALLNDWFEEDFFQSNRRDKR